MCQLFDNGAQMCQFIRGLRAIPPTIKTIRLFITSFALLLSQMMGAAAQAQDDKHLVTFVQAGSNPSLSASFAIKRPLA